MHVKFQNNNIQHSLQKKNNRREIKKVANFFLIWNLFFILLKF